MISDSGIAKKISEVMLDVFARLDESVDLMKLNCPPDEVTTSQRRVGKIVGPIVMDVLGPLLRKAPHTQARKLARRMATGQ
jgi:hypothetical protein